MSQALRKLTGNLQKSQATLFFINQIRMKIGVMFGSPETTSGGNALKFYASQRLDIRRIGTIKVGDVAVGNRCRVKVVKNKLAPPFRLCEFDILFGKGISRTGDVLDLGVEAGIINKSGAWYSYGEERVGQGRDNARNFLEEHPDILAAVERKLLQEHGLLEEHKPEDKPAEPKAEAKARAPAPAKGDASKRPRPN
jgi:recombination protein RecA